MTVTASFPVSSPTVDDVYKRHHYLNTAVTIVDPMTPVLDCTHLVEIHLCSGFCEFICHGPLHEWSALYFTMLGQNSKCSLCGKPNETTAIECSSCEQWLSHCCARLSAGDNICWVEPVPFYFSQCLSTGRHQATSPEDPTQCYHCHSQSGSKRKKTIHVQNVIGPFTCPAWKSQDVIPNHFLVGTTTLLQYKTFKANEAMFTSRISQTLTSV